MGLVHTLWKLSYSRPTTNSFEATTTTEACFFWLPVGGLKPEKEDPVGYTISIQSEINYQLSYQGVFSRITSLLFQYSYAPASAANS